MTREQRRPVDPRLRHRITAPGNRCRRVDDGGIAEQVMTIAWSQGEPPGARNHPADFGIEPVVRAAEAVHFVADPRERAVKHARFGDDR